MTLLQLICGLSITTFWVVRAIQNKEARLRDCSPQEISFTSAVWMILGSCGVAALFWQSDFQPFFAQGTDCLLPLSVSIGKGLALHLLVMAVAQISHHSMSSGAFALTSSLPIGGLTVMLLLGEKLSDWDILAVILIGALSFLFFLKGHAASLTAADKKAYLLIIACNTYNMFSDKMTAVDQSWAVHLTVSTLAWGAIPIVQNFLKKKLRGDQTKLLVHSLKKTPLLILGATYLVSEIFLIYSMQHVFSAVVIAAIFMRIATPLTMLSGALFYQEGRWQDQVLFGGCVIIPALLAIFL